MNVLELQKKVLGEKHPETIRAMANLALTWWQQGRSSEAEKLRVDALELRKKVLGEKHPDTITVMDNLSVMQKG
jgi:Tetratricopeptide repeat